MIRSGEDNSPKIPAPIYRVCPWCCGGGTVKEDSAAFQNFHQMATDPGEYRKFSLLDCLALLFVGTLNGIVLIEFVEWMAH
jgi:hypothetical protein